MNSLSDFFRVGLDQYIILTSDISKAFLQSLKNQLNDGVVKELGLFFLEISNSLYTLQIQCPNQRKVIQFFFFFFFFFYLKIFFLFFFYYINLKYIFYFFFIIYL